MKPAKIPLSGKYGKGKYCLVDVEDVPKVSGVKWHLSDTGYVLNRTNGKTLRIHRVIMNTPDGMDTDHINHNKLDNRKSNLKICTRSENLFNKTNSRGYYFDSKRNRWIVDCKAIGVRWKQFKDEEQAIVFVAESRSNA